MTVPGPVVAADRSGGNVADYTREVDVVFLALADHAQGAEGKLFMSGAGWSLLSVSEFPARKAIGIGIALDLDADDMGTHELVVVIQPESLDKPLLRVEGTVTAEHIRDVPGPARAVVAMNAIMLIPTAGNYVVVLSIDGQERAQTRFRVIEQ